MTSVPERRTADPREIERLRTLLDRAVAAMRASETGIVPVDEWDAILAAYDESGR